MRYFIATPTPIELYGLIKRELSPYIRGNWTLAKNLHLTHLFIGDSNEDRLKFKLNIPNEKIVINGLDSFGDRILYIRASSPNIDTINRQLRKILPDIHNKKPFNPHITLCRVKEVIDRDRLLKAMESLNRLKFTVDFEVFLYSSKLTPRGPIYRKLFKY